MKNKKLKIIRKVRGTSARPRLSVFRSNRYLYAQIINDEKGETIVGVSEKNLKGQKDTKMSMARKLGKLVAELAIKKKIKKVVFDKSGYKYHGLIKELAEGAREGGLIF